MLILGFLRLHQDCNLTIEDMVARKQNVAMNMSERRSENPRQIWMQGTTGAGPTLKESVGAFVQP
jgi:hypothetical protein